MGERVMRARRIGINKCPPFHDHGAFLRTDRVQFTLGAWRSQIKRFKERSTINWKSQPDLQMVYQKPLNDTVFSI